MVQYTNPELINLLIRRVILLKNLQIIHIDRPYLFYVKIAETFFLNNKNNKHNRPQC